MRARMRCELWSFRWVLVVFDYFGAACTWADPPISAPRSDSLLRVASPWRPHHGITKPGPPARRILRSWGTSLVPAERVIRLSAARHFSCSTDTVGHSFGAGGRNRPAGVERERPLRAQADTQVGSFPLRSNIPNIPGFYLLAGLRLLRGFPSL